MVLTVFVALLCIESLSLVAVGQEENITLPLNLPARGLPEDRNICPPEDQQSMLQSLTDLEIAAQVKNIVDIVAPCGGTNIGLEVRCPAKSCNDIFQQSQEWRPSGTYWLENTYGTVIPVYCDMTRECCGTIGGWTRIAYLNMSDTSHSCPSGWRYISSPTRACGSNNDEEIVRYTTHRLEYSHVCGRVIGYHYGQPEAFFSTSIESNYVDGISVTHGDPKQHIWTFAAARGERYVGSSNCPCTNRKNYYAINIPNFVGYDYYCETAAYTSSSGYFNWNDPLWDGAGCGTYSDCCIFNHPPWFCKKLPYVTSEAIEVRLLGRGSFDYEDTPVELIEIYIQ